MKPTPRDLMVAREVRNACVDAYIVNRESFTDDNVAALLESLPEPAEQEQRSAWPPGPYVDIVFTGPPGPDPGQFVEVEDATGASVRFGEWLERDDGYWALRIESPVEPAEQEQAARCSRWIPPLNEGTCGLRAGHDGDCEQEQAAQDAECGPSMQEAAAEMLAAIGKSAAPTELVMEHSARMAALGNLDAEVARLAAKADAVKYAAARAAGKAEGLAEGARAAVEAKLQELSTLFRRTGATLPAPDLTGTPEGSVISGMCVALAVVEGQLDALRRAAQDEPGGGES